MTEPDSSSSTDPAAIEALIARLKQSNLSDRDALLIERLLRLQEEMNPSHYLRGMKVRRQR